jgi:hypothetical protein
MISWVLLWVYFKRRIRKAAETATGVKDKPRSGFVQVGEESRIVGTCDDREWK